MAEQSEKSKTQRLWERACGEFWDKPIRTSGVLLGILGGLIAGVLRFLRLPLGHWFFIFTLVGIAWGCVFMVLRYRRPEYAVQNLWFCMVSGLFVISLGLTLICFQPLVDALLANTSYTSYYGVAYILSGIVFLFFSLFPMQQLHAVWRLHLSERPQIAEELKQARYFG